MATLEHKRGDTLDLSVVMRNADGTPVDMTGWTATSEVRNPDGTLVSSVTVTITDAVAGVFTLSASAAVTALWPVGLLKSDIQFTRGSGDIQSSRTYNINCIENITV